jgi:CubicO group peptidase (beta-lactamase class C family)
VLYDIFRESVEQIQGALDVLRRLMRDWTRYLIAAVLIRRLVRTFMNQHGVPGLSLAISYKGRLVFAKGYGFATLSQGSGFNTTTNVRVRTDHLFRIASLSKPITAVAVFRLLQERRFGIDVGQGTVPALRLNERVFGQNSILGTTFGALPNNSMKDQITVQHLLEHTSGWSNNPVDIMFDTSHLADTQAALITHMVAHQALTHTPPGSRHVYLNFGYLVLGRVIEERSGMPYEDYVRQAVLTPCGISDMHIAGNTLADLRPNEVQYYPSAGSTENPYALRVNRMDAHGGWIASAIDLVRFLVRVDRFAMPPDILTSSSMQTMLTATTAPPPGGSSPVNYAKGWDVQPTAATGLGNYWHLGDLPGTAACFIRTYDEYCFAVLANSRNEANKDQMKADMLQLWWNIYNGVGPWPTGTPL